MAPSPVERLTAEKGVSGYRRELVVRVRTHVLAARGRGHARASPPIYRPPRRRCPPAQAESRFVPYRIRVPTRDLLIEAPMFARTECRGGRVSAHSPSH